MAEKELSTLQVILITAENEFLEKGFRGASLRNIVKEAGVTTGAFYGYFKSKEQLFDALVEEQYSTLMAEYCRVQNEFFELPADKLREDMGKYSGDCMEWMLDYAFEHKNAFKLILTKSEGTKYAHIIDEMARIEAESTHKYIKLLQSLGYAAKETDEALEHMLITGMFNAFFEMIIHDMPLGRAKECLKGLRQFYTAGWSRLMGLD